MLDNSCFAPLLNCSTGSAKCHSCFSLISLWSIWWKKSIYWYNSVLFYQTGLKYSKLHQPNPGIWQWTMFTFLHVACTQISLLLLVAVIALVKWWSWSNILHLQWAVPQRPCATATTAGVFHIIPNAAREIESKLFEILWIFHPRLRLYAIMTLGQYCEGTLWTAF